MIAGATDDVTFDMAASAARAALQVAQVAQDCLVVCARLSKLDRILCNISTSWPEATHA